MQEAPQEVMDTDAIREILWATSGQENLTEAELDAMVERQRKLLAGEEVKEEVKVVNKVQKESKDLNLENVAAIDWGYFSEENLQKVRLQNMVSNAEQARQLRDQILAGNSNFDAIRDITESLGGKSSLGTGTQ